MLKEIRSVMAAILTCAITSLGALPVAHGEPVPPGSVTCTRSYSRIQGVCKQEVTVSSQGGTPGSSKRMAKDSSVALNPQECTNRNTGSKVPCRDRSSYWSNSKNCYVSPMTTVPKSSPIWEGHTDGAVYLCYDPAMQGLQRMFWSAATPEGPAAPPDPRVLARQAVNQMGLRAIDIGIVPEAGPGKVGLVGMPTYMWVADPGPNTIGPITRSASAAGYTVTAVASLESITWNMGDGSTVTCNGPGTPYQDSFGAADSPDCGYRYQKQGKYAVSATSSWSVRWSGIGQSGTIPLTFVRATTIQMGEMQVLNN